MGKIHVLEKNISDKIAAGEVVERPASVIKELVENAVDAQATSICVEIKNGGIRYMRVTDNGVGMRNEDVSLCILRHATSKIYTEEDLEGIATLGFRGEALSSIAAVSKLEIYTCGTEEDIGTHLIAQNGEITEIREAGCPKGTTVLVRELFSVVPARMKFLKKDATEAGYIEDIVTRLALSHAEISVKFIKDGKEVLFTPGDGKQASVIYAVYGKDVREAMLPLSFSESFINISGMCAKGTVSRPNRNMESFFVNGRYIKSPLLSRAVEEAYKNELMVGKFPAATVHISLPPEQVDINVHPTKLEAKFADEKAVYHCVYWAVKNALYSAVAIPQAAEHKAIKQSFEVPKHDREALMQRATLFSYGAKETREKQTEQKKMEHTPKITVLHTPPATPAPQKAPVSKMPPAQTKTQEMPKPFVAKSAPVTVSSTPQEKTNIDSAPIQQISVENTVQNTVENREIIVADEKKSEIIPYKICGQMFSTYILAERDHKMLMVDQHAAHERLRYERLLAEYKNRTITTQMLVVPQSVGLTSSEYATFAEYSKNINQLGLLCEEYGEKTVLIRGVPAETVTNDVQGLFLEILDMYAQNRKAPDEELVCGMLYRIACRGAVKANAKLTEAEMKRLLDDVFSLDGINTCPHGRPIMIEFTQQFIEKQFKRIVT